ncbi:cell division protein ZapE [Brachybacterium sp. GCM10030268]|uniref:cell division protein ZapE n=1 Tax=Brachybacterium sp. GCM10030268 TaxID=3273382 RepID=UPI0036202D5F
MLAERLSDGGRSLDPAQRAVLSTLVSPRAGGVYLWGEVGRGKTWMAQTFYQLAPGAKRAAHVHQFLADLHRALTQKPRSIESTLQHFLDGAEFLYLDEFHLHDVADAHLMRRVLAAARRARIALLMTSNYPPEELLPNPLHHHHALPLIEQIIATTAVAHIGIGRDYRVGVRAHAGFASGEWEIAGPREDMPRTEITLGGASPRGPGARTLRASGADDGVLTVTFARLCQEPLSAADYTRLAQQFVAVRLIDVPPPGLMNEESMQRFAFLIDVLADADIRLDAVSTGGLGEWRTAANLPRDAERLLSRLSLLRERPAGEHGRHYGVRGRGEDSVASPRSG